MTDPADGEEGRWKRLRPYLAGAVVGATLVGALAWADGAFDSDPEPPRDERAATATAPEPPKTEDEPPLGEDPEEGESIEIVAAGDIACDGNCGQDETAALVKEIDPDYVLGLGDYQYERGSAAALAENYDPYWGEFKERTYAVFGGSHDYYWSGAVLDYFNDGGPVELKPEQSYSFDLGAWHFVALNSYCFSRDSCDDEGWGKWLAEDLAKNERRCTLAYFHEPYFTSHSNIHDEAEHVRPWVEILYEAGVDVVLQAHQHFYERFAPQTPDRERDDERGMTAFVVGTGGRSFYDFASDAPNSVVRNNETFGVLRMDLRPDGYDFEFVPEPGKGFTDSGSSTCH